MDDVSRLTARKYPVLTGLTRCERVASAGLASVWKGYRIPPDNPTHSWSAIKQLHTRFHDEEDVVRGFEQEAQWGMLLDHPQFVRVDAFGLWNDRLTIVMPFVQAMTLQQWLSNAKGLSEKERIIAGLWWVGEILSALRYLHHDHGEDRGLPALVHGDLAPDNILITDAATVFLIDLGNATTVHGLRASKLSGKIPYMSPEQCAQRTVDARADLYVVGSLLWEIIRGEAPYPKDNPIRALRMITEGTVPEPLPPGDVYHDEVNALWRQLVARAPNERPKSATEAQKKVRALCARAAFDGEAIVRRVCNVSAT